MTSAFRTRRAVLAILVAAVGTFSACGDETATSTGDARRELQEAIDRTLAAESLHVQVSQSMGGDGDESAGRTSIDFNAPDRFRSVSTADGSDNAESIVIGDRIYFSDFARPGYFMSSRQPEGQSPAENLLAPLEAIRDEDDVRVQGEEYVVRFGDPAATATLRIRDGYVVRLRLQADAGDEELDAVYELSQFGSAAEVAAPPPDRVTDAPITPECPEDGELPEGVLACTGGDFEEPREVDLPTPSEPVDSTLQFRLVRSATGLGCAPRETNPPAGDALSMQDSDGVCLDLSATELEVSRVQSLRATTTDGEDVALNITLHSGDAGRFDEIAEQYLGQQLALVILGRVVSAPTIQATGFEGQLQISGFSMEDAARIKAALTA